MPGPPPKPRNQRARRNKGEGTESTSVVLAEQVDQPTLPAWIRDRVEVKVWGETFVVPKPPRGLLQQTVEAWVTYWIIPETQMLRPHHLPALRRLVRLYDEEERLRRLVEKPWTRGVWEQTPDGDEVFVEEELPGHLGVGSQGQLVEHPNSKILDRKRAEIRQLEDRFAGTPLAEFRVGWQRAHMINEQSRANQAEALAQAARELQERHEAARARRSS